MVKSYFHSAVIRLEFYTHESKQPTPEEVKEFYKDVIERGFDGLADTINLDPQFIEISCVKKKIDWDLVDGTKRG